MTKKTRRHVTKWFLGAAFAAAVPVIALAVTPVDAAPVAKDPPGPLPVSASQNGPWTVSVDNFPAAPPAAPAPLWPGTPYVATKLLLHVDFEECEAFPAVPEGQVLFLERATATVDVHPGDSGTANISFTPLGGTEQRLRIPVEPTAPILQADGNHDGYSGTLELGIPVTGAGACFHGEDVIGQMAVIGYLVPAGS